MSLRRTILGLALGVVGALTGCAAPDSPTDLEVAAGEYPAAFEAAKAALRDYRFDLERVDARAGVISTAKKETAGLLTPWDKEQSSFEQELEDAVQHQRRLVRITFEEPAQAGAADDETEPDLREAAGPLVMRVRAVIERVNRPGWRLNTTAIGLSTHAWSQALAEREMLPEFEVAVIEDRALSARLVKEIQERQSRSDRFEPPGNWKPGQ